MCELGERVLRYIFAGKVLSPSQFVQSFLGNIFVYLALPTTLHTQSSFGIKFGKFF